MTPKSNPFPPLGDDAPVLITRDLAGRPMPLRVRPQALRGPDAARAASAWRGQVQAVRARHAHQSWAEYAAGMAIGVAKVFGFVAACLVVIAIGQHLFPVLAQ